MLVPRTGLGVLAGLGERSGQAYTFPERYFPAPAVDAQRPRSHFAPELRIDGDEPIHRFRNVCPAFHLCPGLVGDHLVGAL